MKKTIIPEFLWHLDKLCICFQVTIITTMDAEGRVNAAPFGLVLPYSGDPERPQMMVGSNRIWHTAQNIEATGEFVINYPSFSLYSRVSECGRLYDEGVNELEKVKRTDPLFLFGIDLSTFTSYYLKGGETKSFSLKEE